MFVDGQGIAHPRRCGDASHLDLLLDLPTIGCGKSRLLGVHREPGARRGARTPLRERGDVIGTVLRTRPGAKPIYVSVGHRIDLATAARLVTQVSATRIPEPIKIADRLSRGW